MSAAGRDDRRPRPRPVHAPRRWLRRYALAVGGGVVILFWFAVALLAPC